MMKYRENTEATEMEEIGNELIAKFMGYEKVRVGYWDDNDPDDGETQWQRDNNKWLEAHQIYNVGLYAVNLKENTWYHWEELNFHLSWDWLMPVIQKIHHNNSVDHAAIYLDIEKQYLKVISHIQSLNH